MQPGVKNTRTWIALLSALAIVAAALLFVRITKNPPGFYIDESSIAYNAHTIARTGCDENGIRWPLYFRAFGDYKNPVYIYVLAGLFRFTGPSILVPRLLSAVLVVLAAAVLGVLAFRQTQSRTAALLIGIFTLVTPWLFEVGHVAMEVALYPLATGLFLLCLQRAAGKDKWGDEDVVPLAAALALLTYSYSIGRLFAPLLALGLMLFWKRGRRRDVIAVWVLYGLFLIPLALFSFFHHGALVDRFRIITWLRPDTSCAGVAWEFVEHYFRNLNPWRLLVSGDPNPDQIVHVFGTALFLGPIFVFSMTGLALIVRAARHELWPRFLLYAFAVSFVPASLTKEPFHMLRLIAVPMFLIVFAIPGLAWFIERSRNLLWRVALFTLLGLTAIEATWFQWNYHRTARTARRVHLFDAEYRKKIFEPAIASNHDPIYLADALWIPGYIQAYWYGTLKGIDLSRFNRLPPDKPVPLGGLMISTEENCPGCEIVASSPPYTLAIAKEPPRARVPLPREALRAELTVVEAPPRVRANGPAEVLVRVRNASQVVWPARERGGGPYQVSLGNHWLDASGKTLINDNGRSALLRDLAPGETVAMRLMVTTPEPGHYLLEIDMLQEGVSWFGLVGSPTVRLPVEVE
jgi:4-amino-4-deoxy-L-arabinose transferase-like glycosyltransferase